ncbi:MAG: diadenylate cyclase CdaA [Vampirovibrio sp.]|nr:diadenylate cyclase CdaA [Vampirovibrio sp.]
MVDPVWLESLQMDWFVLAKYGLQLAILIGIIALAYVKLIRNSHAEQLLKGLFVILLLFISLWGSSHVLGLEILESVFSASTFLLIIGLIVVFQPELRRVLLFLGQPEFFGKQSFSASSQERKAEFLVQELTDAVKFMSKSKMGALIVLETANTGEGNYLEAGTKLDARLSTEMLLTIFHPNTPLHDGAVVISSENRLAAAGVLLPLTEDPKLSWQYGTRHRAAIGLTETSDSRCIVVSEETGSISIVIEGKLEKMAGVEEFAKRLQRLYNVSGTPDKKAKSKVTHIGERFTGLFSPDGLSTRFQKIWNRRGEAWFGPKDTGKGNGPSGTSGTGTSG